MIVDEFNVAPVDFLFRILLLLHFENMLSNKGIGFTKLYHSEQVNLEINYKESVRNLIKVLLKLLVCQIYAKLFKTVEICNISEINDILKLLQNNHISSQ